MLDDITNKTIS